MNYVVLIYGPSTDADSLIDRVDRVVGPFPNYREASAWGRENRGGREYDVERLKDPKNG